MKKTLCILMVLLISAMVFSGFAEVTKEITFQGIPWLVNEETVKNQISDYLEKGYVYAQQPNTSGIVLRKDEELHAYPITTRDYSDRCSCFSLEGTTEAKIAGYEVAKILFSFSRDTNELSLLCVRVDLNNAKFNDLNEKLKKVYGDGETGTNEDGLVTVLWKGSNESCVLLYSIDEGETASLLYGRLDAEEIINTIIIEASEEVDPEDVTGL